MRVKLSYSVDEKDVLSEAAKMLNLTGDDLKEAIDLFQTSQQELGKQEADPPNIEVALKALESLRKCLLAVDTRVAEVSSVVVAYDDYRRHSRTQDEAPPEEDDQDDNFGSD